MARCLSTCAVARLKQRLLLLSLTLAFAVWLPACGTTPGGKTTNGKPPGGRPGTGTTTRPAGSCGGDRQFQLTGAGAMDDPCAFDPVDLRNSNCQLLRIDAEATGVSQVPPGVIFEKDGTAFDRTANASSAGTWSATTTHFNCSTGPGCADGTYAVRLQQQENPILCSEYGNVTLRLVLR